MSSFVRGTTSPQVFSVNGSRRAVPDTATLKFISQGRIESAQRNKEVAKRLRHIFD